MRATALKLLALLLLLPLAVPAQDYPAILQGAVIMRGTKNALAARRFLDFLQSPGIAQTLANSGLEPVQQAH